MLARLGAIIGCAISKGQLSASLDVMLSNQSNAGEKAAPHSDHLQAYIASIAAAAVVHLSVSLSASNLDSVCADLQLQVLMP